MGVATESVLSTRVNALIIPHGLGERRVIDRKACQQVNGRSELHHLIEMGYLGFFFLFFNRDAPARTRVF
jgi:hypothetical protein